MSVARSENRPIHDLAASGSPLNPAPWERATLLGLVWNNDAVIFGYELLTNLLFLIQHGSANLTSAFFALAALVWSGLVITRGLHGHDYL